MAGNGEEIIGNEEKVLRETQEVSGEPENFSGEIQNVMGGTEEVSGGTLRLNGNGGAGNSPSRRLDGSRQPSKAYPHTTNVPMSRPKKASAPVLKPRLRVVVGEDIALGPGKIELLALIAETGSIAEAAKRMEMSYMRAWTLVQQMEACFTEPLLDRQRGGAAHGGAALTENGLRVLELYRAMETESLRAMEKSWRELRLRLRG